MLNGKGSFRINQVQTMVQFTKRAEQRKQFDSVTLIRRKDYQKIYSNRLYQF